MNAGGGAVSGGADGTLGALPDEAYAAAFASLPDMTPQRLERVLGDRPGVEVHEELMSGSDRLVESLFDLSSFSAGERSRSRRASGDPRRAPSREEDEGGGATGGFDPDDGMELARDLERRRARIAEVLSWWRSELGTRSVEERWRALEASGIWVVRRRREGYPPRLLRSPAPPALLYVRGRLDHAQGELTSGGRPSVAIVGTRRASVYGKQVAAEFGSVLAEMGVVIVSGLAKGIDAAAHEGALALPGSAPPLAVAGTGLDVVFPRESARLWGRVAAAGGVVSEFSPGSQPEGWRFPLRNRIIAALSDVLVVVESARQGGAMHTLHAADDIGVPVLAVPGSIRSQFSEGTNAAIRDGGAGLAADVDDVLAALAMANPGAGSVGAGGGRSGGGPSAGGRRPSPAARRARAGSGGRGSAPRRGRPANPRLAGLLRLCSDSERAVYDVLDEVPASVNAVCRLSGMPLGGVVLALDRLEELGLAVQVGSSWVKG